MQLLTHGWSVLEGIPVGLTVVDLLFQPDRVVGLKVVRQLDLTIPPARVAKEGEV